MSFSFLIIGGGSIGLRHARNLRVLGQHDIVILEPEAQQKALLRQEDFAVVDDMNLEEVDAVLVCSPSTYHLQHTRQAVEAGTHVFVEKPISHTWEGVEELIALAQDKGITALVGFNLRFREGYRRAKALLAEGRLGTPLAARANCSYYLPHYHPNKDYRTRYQAQRALGGGVLLDDIHEIDYLMDLFGGISEVYARVERLSKLEIDVEDYAGMMFTHQSGVISQVQLDFLSRSYRRTLEITGSEATLTLDHNSGKVRIFGPQDHHYEAHLQGMSVTVNQMYLDEMQHFLDCLEGRAEPAADLAAGGKALRVALAARQSSQQRKVIQL